MEQNKVSNWDAKKAFSEFVLENKTIPPIYIDEYWDYYLNEYNLTEEWNSFLKDFQEDKLDFITFINEFYKILNSVTSKLLSNREEFNNKCNKILSELNPNIQTPRLKTWDFPDGDYLVIDMHGAFDEVFKYIEILDSKYKNTYELINDCTQYKSFKNKKSIRISIYDHLFSPNEMTNLYQITNNILLEKILKSEDPEIKKVAEHLTFAGKTYGDSYAYKINDTIPSNIFKDYDCDGLKYHIEKWEIRTVNIFGNLCKCTILKDKEDKITDILLFNNENKLNIAYYPFTLKLISGEELNEKDLVVGWDDQIFFHFDKSEII